MIRIGEHICVDNDISIPLLYGTTVSVEEVMELASEGLDERQIRRALGILPKGASGVSSEAIDAAIAFARDSWCTPVYVAETLPPRHRLIDPCSNPRSVVQADRRLLLELGLDGLAMPWFAEQGVRLLAYVNAGFSNLMPWVEKLRAERERISGAAFMCNSDPSTRWWKALTEQCSCVFFFDNRIQFIPFPGVAKSTNNKPQALVGDRSFFAECKPELFELGEMYEKSEPSWARRVA